MKKNTKIASKLLSNDPNINEGKIIKATNDFLTAIMETRDKKKISSIKMGLIFHNEPFSIEVKKVSLFDLASEAMKGANYGK